MVMWSMFLGVEALTVDCVRPSHVYRAGETAEFDVTDDVPGRPLVVRFTCDGETELATVVTTAPARVCRAFPRPGFLRCTVSAPSNVWAEAAAGFDPYAIRPIADEPADFDAFWARAFRKLAATPPEETWEELAPGGWKIVCNTVGRKMIGYLRLPPGKGPFPLKVIVGGGSSSCSDAQARGVKGALAQLHIHMPPYAPGKTQAETDANERAWNRAHHPDRDPATYYLYMLEGRGKRPEDLYLHACILGGCRLIDLAVRRPEIDAARVVCEGTSHGGAFGIYFAAFSPHVRAAFCGKPDYGDVMGARVGRHRNNLGKDYLPAFGQLRYFDTAFVARRVTKPVFLNIGFIDRSNTPTACFAIYNELGGPRQLFTGLHANHPGNPPELAPMRDAWLSAFLR